MHARTHKHSHTLALAHSHTYTATFSLLSRQRVRGQWLLSACQEAARGRKKGGLGGEKKEGGVCGSLVSCPRLSTRSLMESDPAHICHGKCGPMAARPWEAGQFGVVMCVLWPRPGGGNLALISMVAPKKQTSRISYQHYSGWRRELR